MNIKVNKGDSIDPSELVKLIRKNTKRIYTQENRISDFHYFLEKYDVLFNRYGHCYIAIRFEKILGIFNSRQEAVNTLSDCFDIGEYIVQECNGDESAYTSFISTCQLADV